MFSQRICLAAVSVLLLIPCVCQAQETTATDNRRTTGEQSNSSRPRMNASTMLDSINKDLEEIKRTLEENINRTDARRKHYDERTEHLAGHFIEKGGFVKDLPYTECSKPTAQENIYQFSISKLNESEGEINFRNFRGKPILIVNVATFCESTIEYPLYNNLKDQFGDQLVIVAFPCNQFLNQEPTGDAEEVYNAIKYVRPGNGFVPKFPLTKRVDVNGLNQNEIYSFLKRSCPSTRTRFSSNEKNLLYDQKNSRDIRWNFEKFLIHPNTGYAVKRYDQKYLPNRIIPDIEDLIKEAKQVF